MIINEIKPEAADLLNNKHDETAKEAMKEAFQNTFNKIKEALPYDYIVEYLNKTLYNIKILYFISLDYYNNNLKPEIDFYTKTIFDSFYNFTKYIAQISIDSTMYIVDHVKDFIHSNIGYIVGYILLTYLLLLLYLMIPQIAAALATLIANGIYNLFNNLMPWIGGHLIYIGSQIFRGILTGLGAVLRFLSAPINGGMSILGTLHRRLTPVTALVVNRVEHNFVDHVYAVGYLTASVTTALLIQATAESLSGLTLRDMAGNNFDDWIVDINDNFVQNMPTYEQDEMQNRPQNMPTYEQDEMQNRPQNMPQHLQLSQDSDNLIPPIQLEFNEIEQVAPVDNIEAPHNQAEIVVQPHGEITPNTNSKITQNSITSDSMPSSSMPSLEEVKTDSMPSLEEVQPENTDLEEVQPENTDLDNANKRPRSVSPFTSHIHLTDQGYTFASNILTNPDGPSYPAYERLPAHTPLTTPADSQPVSPRTNPTVTDLYNLIIPENNNDMYDNLDMYRRNRTN